MKKSKKSASAAKSSKKESVAKKSEQQAAFLKGEFSTLIQEAVKGNAVTKGSGNIALDICGTTLLRTWLGGYTCPVYKGGVELHDSINVYPCAYTMGGDPGCKMPGIAPVPSAGCPSFGCPPILTRVTCTKPAC